MDVERTIEFILKSQAKTDTRLTGITKLMQQGRKMLVKIETNMAELAQAQKRTEAKVTEWAEAHNELAREMKELAKAQKHTERALRAFILGQRHGRNGR